jgi:antitoxin component YwqK of YwqJK toxin-antitoxin module
MKNTIILLILIAFMSNVNAQEVTREYYENGQLRSVGKYTRGEEIGEQIGEWKWYYENGQLKKIAKYGDVGEPYNEEIGEAKSYYENGQLSRYDNHLSNGKSLIKKYYNNGQLSIIGKYFDYNEISGKVGEWKYYYQNGQLAESVKHSSDGKVNGERKQFYRNGILKEYSNWSKGYEVGKTKFYYPNGQLSKSGKMYNNSPRSILRSNKSYQIGEWSSIQGSSTGNEIGEWKYYYENGQLREIGNWNKCDNYNVTCQTGEWKYYYENGKLECEGNWETENWIWYDKNGKKTSTNNIVPLTSQIADSVCILMTVLNRENVPPQTAIKKILIVKKLIPKNATKKEIGDFINNNFKKLNCKTTIVNSSVKAQHMYQRAFDDYVSDFFYDVVLEEEYGININNQFFDKRTQTNITLLDHINYIINDPYELSKYDEDTLNDIRDGIIEMGGKTTKELEGNK